MPDLLEIDERTYRSYIAYEALHKKPVEKAYKRMKRVMPNIDYFDFQYWYFRFLSGNLDLSHDRNKDPKTPLFSDMPIEVVDIIVGKLDAASKLSVRKVSKSLRSIVDSQKTKCHSVSLSLYRSFSKLRIENSLVTYKSENDTFSKYKAKNEYDSSDSDEDSPKWKLRKWANKKSIVEEKHLKAALKDFSSFLMNPNWKFKKLTIDFGSEHCDDPWVAVEEAMLIRALDPLLSKFQIHVENLTVKSTSLAPMVTFLPYFKSGVLKALGFSSDVMDRDILEKIMKMDHWKNAEKFKFEISPESRRRRLRKRIVRRKVWTVRLSIDRKLGVEWRRSGERRAYPGRTLSQQQVVAQLKSL
ncbi:unnamed protein product [Caenorhabditis brenneri]